MLQECSEHQVFKATEQTRVDILSYVVPVMNCIFQERY